MVYMKDLLGAGAVRSLETEGVLSGTIYCHLMHQGEDNRSTNEMSTPRVCLFVRSCLRYEICCTNVLLLLDGY